MVECCVFGAPRFSGFWDLWTENRGAPKTRNSTTTDPTPHSRPLKKQCPQTLVKGRAERDGNPEFSSNEEGYLWMRHIGEIHVCHVVSFGVPESPEDLL